MKLRQSEGEAPRDQDSQQVKGVNHALHLMNWVLDHLLYYHSEPQSVELGHVVTESVHESHRLAQACLRRSMRLVPTKEDLIEGLREILYEDRLKDCANHVNRLKGQDDQEESTHVTPMRVFRLLVRSYLDLG